MTTTKRLLIMVILINLVMGLIGGIYTNVTYDQTRVNNYVTIGEEQRNEIINDEGTSKPIEGTQLEESTRGNTLSMSSLIFDILWYGLAPFPFQRNQFNNSIEQLMVDILGLFRIFMYAIVIYELFAVLKNKKTD